MELDLPNCESSLRSLSLSSHFCLLVLLSSVVRILGFCSGLWFGFKPAEDWRVLMQRDHGSWSMIWFTYVGVGPRLLRELL